MNDNYIITFLESSFTITERPVTVTAESKMKNFGDTDPGLTIIITSGRLIGTDTFHGSLVRESGENVGTYSIRQGSLSLSDNYIMTFESSELTILPRPVTITANPRTKYMEIPIISHTG
ncbi:MAG: hypothetical protein IPN67_20885 [Bacteroidales bacterium]|nr:hypothetical protein [Bacteroidales bacterium]